MLISSALSSLPTRTATLLLLLSTWVPAQIHVPADHPSLAGALAAAAPGEVIIITGGVHPPVFLTQAVTLVGALGNPPLLRASLPGEEPVPGVQAPAITLAGPGSGVVRLVNLRLSGMADGSWYAQAAPGLAGGGFRSVELSDCQISAASWEFASGYAAAADGVLLDPGVDSLLVSSCLILGGQGANDSLAGLPVFAPRGGAAVRAPSTLVTVLDSQLRGGKGTDVAIYPALGCPGSCDDVVDGQGGEGLVAATLLRANALILGGEGAQVGCISGGMAVITCQAARGDDVLSPSRPIMLPDRLHSDGSPIAGLPWLLSWDSSASTVLMLFSIHSQMPVPFGDRGYLFCDPASSLFLGLTGASVVFQVPADSGLLGLPVMVQIFEQGVGLSRPISGVVLPPVGGL